MCYSQLFSNLQWILCLENQSETALLLKWQGVAADSVGLFLDSYLFLERVQELCIITLAQPQCRRSIIFPQGLCKCTAYIPLHFTLQQADKEHLNHSCSAATVPSNSTALPWPTWRLCVHLKLWVKTPVCGNSKTRQNQVPSQFYSRTT